MAKKVRKARAREGEQYMMRMPPGLRERVTKRAAANGRSMSAEIIDAIEQSLQRADRIALVWEFFQTHREQIEQIPLIGAAVENLEIYAERRGDDDEFRGGLRALRRHKEEQARLASLPVVTAEQAAHIRTLLKEIGRPEDKFCAALKVPSIEEIRDYKSVIEKLEYLRRHDRENPPA
jgi:predicted DNA-binding protein